ncbi:ornithine cyclodeaminase family protein [Haloferax sp. DFSO52]|uniref:ornithine cyclodeaminase family protein n=1 Tax=Haloferax sp. DFSO52 TaxID=3388505 RepID=UPI003A857CD8
MTRLLTNDDISSLLTPDTVIDLIENAFEELGRRSAKTLPRRRIYLPREGTDDEYYWFNEMAGVVPSQNAMAIRLDSATVDLTEKRGNVRFAFPDAFAGLVLLFDTESNELLAMFQDFYVNPFRVAATSAVGIRHLAREDSKTMGLFGSGTQAALQIEHACVVRDLNEIRVYSTAPDRRADFAARLDDVVDPDVVPVEDPKEAVSGCDIVTTATNSNEPVFDGSWLEPGTHVNTMIGSDAFIPRRETDDETVRRSDIVVVNSLESVYVDKQPELYGPLRRNDLTDDDIYELADLVVGNEIHGRSSGNQITYHNNNVGMGIQFAAVCKHLYDIAESDGLGTEIDSAFFTQYNHDLARIRDEVFLRK